MASEKNLPASPTKLLEARKKGDHPKSKDLVGFVQCLAGLIVVPACLLLGSPVERLLALSLEQISSSSANLFASLTGFLALGAQICLIPLVIIWFSAFLVEILQLKGVVQFQALSFDMGRMNPAKSVKNIFLVNNSSSPIKIVYELLRRFILLLVGGLAVLIVTFLSLFALIEAEVVSGLSVLLGALKLGGLGAALSFLAVYLVYSLADVGFSRNQWLQRNKMDVQELRDELKSTEGNPEVKQSRREIHREILREAALDSLRGSRVLITN